MAHPDPAQLRNVVVLGHRGSGKTSLVEAMLHAAGGTSRLGRVVDDLVESAVRWRSRGRDNRPLITIILDGTHPPHDPRLPERMQGLVDTGRRGDAVRLFMRTVGAPAVMIAMMRLMPAWKKLVAVAHTLPYDLAIVGPHGPGRPLLGADAECKSRCGSCETSFSPPRRNCRQARLPSLRYGRATRSESPHAGGTHGTESE